HRAAARREGSTGLRPFQPGAGDDLGAGQGGAGPPRRLPPRRRLFGRRRPPTGEAPPGVRRHARARDDPADRLRDLGDGLDEIAGLHGIPRVTLRYAWGQLPNVRDVARALEREPDIAAAVMIQHETSVGLLNPIGELGRLCRQHGVTSIVDAVSALGVEDVDVVRDAVDLCYSSANKCLHSTSGVSFLCVAPEVWPRIAAVEPRVYYLDLKRHRRYLDELSQTPFTPAVSSF